MRNASSDAGAEKQANYQARGEKKPGSLMRSGLFHFVVRDMASRAGIGL